MEDGDGEIEAEEDGSNISGQIKLDVKKISIGVGSMMLILTEL